MELNIEKFSPTTADLRQLVAQTSQITATDLKDKAQLKLVKENRTQLADARISITKIGKALREDAIAFQKAVITKEKELVAIVEPEELRLKAIEEEAKKQEEMERRMETLPRRIEVLQAVGIESSETEILSMDDNQFIEWKNAKVAEQQEAERIKLEAERQAIEREKAQIQLEKDMAEATEKAREDERKRIETETLASEARAKQEKEAEAKKLASQEKYQTFLAQNGYTEATKAQFYIARNGNEIALYKLVATYINQD